MTLKGRQSLWFQAKCVFIFNPISWCDDVIDSSCQSNYMQLPYCWSPWFKWSTVAICKRIERGAQELASTLSKEECILSWPLSLWNTSADLEWQLHSLTTHNEHADMDVTLYSYQSTHTTHKLSWQADHEADGYTWAVESTCIYGPNIATILQVAIVLSSCALGTMILSLAKPHWSLAVSLLSL